MSNSYDDFSVLKSVKVNFLRFSWDVLDVTLWLLNIVLGYKGFSVPTTY